MSGKYVSGRIPGLFAMGTEVSNFKVGTEVSCPECRKVMVRCLRVPERGSLDWADCFEVVHWQRKEGQWPRCDCGTPFALPGVGLHVKGIGFTW